MKKEGVTQSDLQVFRCDLQLIFTGISLIIMDELQKHCTITTLQSSGEKKSVNNSREIAHGLVVHPKYNTGVISHSGVPSRSLQSSKESKVLEGSAWESSRKNITKCRINYWNIQKNQVNRMI